jgi:phthiodiolone/phenolphthiodiolone dimycocerosates ketoreductase
VSIHDDPDIIEATLTNPLVKFSAATFGRFKHSDWASEGYDLIFPSNYHYALHLLPSELTREECERVAGAVPDQMVKDAYLSGSAKQVAAQMQEYIDAGANWVQLCDITQIAGLIPMEEAPQQVGRQIEVMRILKENAGVVSG